MQTLGAMIQERCRTFCEQYALAFRDRHEVRRITYEKTLELAENIASGLVAEGLKDGVRIAIIGENSPEWMLAYLAIHLAGGIDVAVDPEAGRMRIAGLLEQAGCRAAFAANDSIKNHIQAALSIPVFKLTWQAPEQDLTTLCRHRQNRRLPVRRLPDDPASIVFKRNDPENTGGVVLTHKSILGNLALVAEAVPLTAKDRLLAILPLWHTSGRTALHLTLWTGSTLALGKSYRLEEDLIELKPSLALGSVPHFQTLYYRLLEGRNEDSTITVMLRKLYFAWSRLVNQSQAFLETNRLALHPGKAPLKLTESILHTIYYFIGFALCIPGDIFIGSALRKSLGNPKAIMIGGDKIPAELDDFFQTLRIAVLSGYWLTEVSHMAACRKLPAPGQHARLLVQTVGPLLTGMELKIKNTGGDDITHIPGQRGTIFLRGPGIMQGYLHNKARTQEVLDENGWLNTRDRGYLKASGELVIG